MKSVRVAYQLKESDGGLVVGIYGLDWGDEGKGRWTNQMAPYASAIVRLNGGTNAGHEIVTPNGKRTLNNFSTGLYHPDCVVVTDRGGSLNIQRGWEEIERACEDGFDRKETLDRIAVNELTPVITPLAIFLDQSTDFKMREGKWTSTGNGVKQTFSSIPGRFAIRARDVAEGGKRYGDAVRKYIESELKWFGTQEIDSGELEKAIEETRLLPKAMGSMSDCVVTVGELQRFYRDILDENGLVLLEGAQSTGLDQNYGQLGQTTSSDCTARASISNTELPRSQRIYVIGATKACPTRVGDGALPTRMDTETESIIREKADEYGRRTGRPRNVGWPDTVHLADSIAVNEPDVIALAKIDALEGHDVKVGVNCYLDGRPVTRYPRSNDEQARMMVEYELIPGFEGVRGVTRWEDLPDEAMRFVDALEKETARHLCGYGWQGNVPGIGLIGTGPESSHSIVREELFTGDKRVLLELFQ